MCLGPSGSHLDPSPSHARHTGLLFPDLPLGPFSAAPCAVLLVLLLPHLQPAEMPAYLRSLLLADCFSFSCHSLSSCWVSVHSLCLVWLVPALAQSWALQGQAWFMSAVGHPWVRRSGAQEMVVTQMVNGPLWQELCWKPFEPSCPVGTWSGDKRLSLFPGPLSRGAVRGPFSPQPGLEANISA